MPKELEYLEGTVVYLDGKRVFGLWPVFNEGAGPFIVIYVRPLDELNPDGEQMETRIHFRRSQTKPHPGGLSQVMVWEGEIRGYDPCTHVVPHRRAPSALPAELRGAYPDLSESSPAVPFDQRRESPPETPGSDALQG